MSTCGTYAGWNTHQRNGTPTCLPCHDARRDYMRAWRIRTGRVHEIRIPVDLARAAAAEASPATAARLRAIIGTKETS